MLKLTKYLKPYLFFILLIIALTFVQVYVNLQLPDYMADIVNEGIVLENTDFIINTGLEMLLISLFGGIATLTSSFYASRIATKFAMKLREEVFKKVSDFSLTEFNKFSISSLITRTTNDIQQVQTVFFMLSRIVFMAPMMGGWAVYLAHQKAPSMSWTILLAVTVICLLIITIFLLGLPKFKIVQKMVDRLNRVTREQLTGLKVVRAFTTEEYERKRFDGVNKDLTKVNLFVNRLMVVTQPLVMLIFNLTALLIVWVGADAIGKGDLQIGDMIAFIQYSSQILMSFLMIAMLFIMIPRASVSGQRISEVLAVKPKINDPKKPLSFNKEEKGKLEFKDVTFSYSKSDEPVLKNISFKAKAGETTAIIGSTGSGKSTLIDLIPRFYEVSKGSIKLDGVDIRKVKQEDLRKKIGYVPQKAILFSGDVGSNVKLGIPNATDQVVKKAVKIAQANEFVTKMENGFKSKISQGGKNVSGGQKQRLSIARAIAKKPEFYIFDDSFSALDFKTASLLRIALNKELGEATVIIVGQRINTIINADNIIVLDEGRIVGQGTHSKLMKKCRVYKEIAESQLSEEELKQL